MSTQEALIGYWLQWQVLLCAVIIAGPSFLALKYIKASKQESLKYVDLWNTCWKSVDPLWLLFYRAFAFLSMAKMLYEFLVLFPAFTLVFYTQWTFILVTLYFGLGTIISAHGCFVARNELKGKPKSKSQQKAGYFGNMMQIMYLTSAGASMLTDIVFWCLIVPFLTSMEFEMTLLIGAMHALNAGFLIVDTALNRMPFSSLGFAYFIIFSCLYIIFVWTIHAFGVDWSLSLDHSDFPQETLIIGYPPWFYLLLAFSTACNYLFLLITLWPYPFLDLNTPWAPVSYLGLALVHIPCYWIYTLVVKAKCSIFTRLFPRAFVRLNT